MIVDRYDPVRLFDLVPQLALEMEPELAQLDRLLEDDALFQRVKADLARRAPLSLVHGRHSTPVEVVLRMLVVRRLYAWSYAATEHFVSDSLVLRQFCRLGFARAPDDSTLIRWAGLIRPATLERLNDHVVALARQLKVTRGRKLRTDGTVVETTIHHPSDSSLLVDGVRVLGRLVGGAKRIARELVAVGEEALADRLRDARALDREIGETARRRGDEATATRQGAYARLVEIAAASLEDAGRLLGQVREGADAAVGKLRGRLERVVPLVEQVVDQACRRVFGGEAVPAGEKLVSLCEPHTAIIVRGKADRPAEFGHKVWLDEVDGGIVSRYQVLVGNPADAGHLAPSLAHHQRLFGHPPGPARRRPRGPFRRERARRAVARGRASLLAPAGRALPRAPGLRAAGVVPGRRALPGRDRGADQRDAPARLSGALPGQGRGRLRPLDRLGRDRGQPDHPGRDGGQVRVDRPKRPPRSPIPQQTARSRLACPAHFISHQKLATCRRVPVALRIVPTRDICYSRARPGADRAMGPRIPSAPGILAAPGRIEP